ncbi:MAG TPA: hypothetical protein VMM55_04545 [Thermohalobaculum sp.]|nr:hypothetical protein [Thermohalobaculum sp.]
MAGNAYAVLRQAILDRSQVACIYKGLPREICPHVIGLKNGREKVLSYQFAGQSSKGLPPQGEWRCMFVDEITDAVGRAGEWHTSGPHTQPQTCVDQIDVEIAY